MSPVRVALIISVVGGPGRFAVFGGDFGYVSEVLSELNTKEFKCTSNEIISQLPDRRALTAAFASVAASKHSRLDDQVCCLSIVD